MDRYIFFLIIISISFSLTIPNAYAAKELFQDHEEEIIGDIIKWTQTLGTNRILDTGEYSDYIFTDTPNYLQVETMFSSVRLDKDSCEVSYYGSGIIGGKSPLFIDDISPYQSVIGSDIWNYISGLDNASCTASWNGSELIAKKQSGVGIIEYVYKYQNYFWKTELRVVNLSGLNDRLFGFQQTFDLNRDSIRYGGSLRNLDNFDGATFDRAWLVNNEGKVINLLNGYNYDFDLGFDQLNTVWINDTGVNSSLLTFQYFYNQTILLNGQTLIIDPTFSDDNPTLDNAVRDNTGNDVCDTGITLFDNTVISAYAYDVADANECYRAQTEYDITSIDDSATIIDVDFTFEGAGDLGSYGIDFLGLTSQPSTPLNAADLFTAITNGDLLLNNQAINCDSASESYDLSSAGDTYVQGRLVSNYVSIAIKVDDETVGGILRGCGIASETHATLDAPLLTIEYIIGNPVDVIDDLTLNARYAEAVDLSWTQPSLNGGELKHYLVNYTTPEGNPTTVSQYINATSATVTGLTWSTDYSFRVTAIDQASSQGNITAPLASIVNSTTLFMEVIDDLASTDIRQNEIDLTWTQPLLYGEELQTYLVNYSTPQSSNPTTVSQYINATSATVGGLTWGTEYSFRVTGLTQDAQQTNITAPLATILNLTTTFTEYLVPPTITDVNDNYHSLTTQLNAEWTSGSMDNINGYRIQRETPKGSGWNTIVTNTTTTTLFYNNTGLSTNVIYNYRILAMNNTGITTVSNEFDMTTHKLPYSVTDLAALATDLSSVELDWTEPLYFAPVISGYNINYTTPEGDPIIVLVVNTGSTSTSYTVTGLSLSSDYSFRVSAVTVHGNNITLGNIANATAFSPLVIGEIALPTTGGTPEDITFTRTDLNTTSSTLEVFFPTGADLACEFEYNLAVTSKTHTGLTSIVIDSTRSATVFVFHGVNNEIIDVYCWDQNNTETNGTYLITQRFSFPFLDVITQFRDGTWGTEGQFSALDFTTLLVIIVSMAGFNRKNEAAGVILSVIIIGVTGYFGIVEPVTVVFGFLALVVMVVIGGVKK